MISRMRASLVPALVAQIAVLAAAPAVARDRTVACTLEVDGRTYLDGPCTFSPERDGSFSIGTGTAKTAKPFFAYVNKNEDGTAEAFWNEEAGVTHAQSPLGTVTRHGACWINRRARVCAE